MGNKATEDGSKGEVYKRAMELVRKHGLSKEDVLSRLSDFEELAQIHGLSAVDAMVEAVGKEKKIRELAVSGVPYQEALARVYGGNPKDLIPRPHG
jgi:hypothetical protein